MADLEQMAQDLKHTRDEFEILHAFVMVDGGKGNPSLASRVTQVETSLASISSNLGHIVWLLVGMFVAILGDIAVHASWLKL